MKIAASDWPTISALFDEALALSAPERSRWLDALPPQHRVHRSTLEGLLSDLASVETEDFLNALPRVGVAEPASPAEAGGGEQTVGPYRLLRELGRGGMGSVWLAERSDGLIKRSVALKLPHSGVATRSFTERLERERDILAALTHPNIARLYDAGISAEGQAYLALEYVTGQDLLAHCETHRLGLRERIDLFQQVLSAVQYAHAQLVLHRDLKPANVMVGVDGGVRLLDFGIAKLMSDGAARETELTALEGRALTPDYASPEQIMGRPLGTGSDVYSLGVLLFELLTGQRPYRLKRGTRGEIEQAILEADPQRPSHVPFDAATTEARDSTSKRLRVALSGDLDTIVLKALRKDPAQRYPTVQAMSDDLSRHLDGRAVLARASSPVYALRRFVDRNRLAVAGTGVVMLALVAATGVSLRQAGIAREHARTAEAALGFLEDIFNTNSTEQPDPAKARQTSARELLDLGNRRIDSALADAPEARLRVATTLARLYDDLDLRAEVVTLHRKRVELTRSLHGSENRSVADALVDVASAASDNGQHALAATSLDEAGAILDRLHDERSLSRARWELAKNGQVNMTGEKLELGMAHLQRALGILRALPPSSDLVGALDELTHVYVKLGRADEAADASAEALRVASIVPGGMKNRMPYLWQSAGDVALARDDLAEAQHALEKALAAAQENSGPRSTTALSVMSDIGYLLVGESKFGPAVERLAAAAKLAEAIAGTSDGSSVEPIAVRRYGAALTHYGRPEEALQALAIARGLWKEEMGSDEDALLLGETAAADLELGRLGAARTALDQREELLRRKNSGRAGRSNESVIFRVQLLILAGTPAEADAALASYVPEARAKPGSRLALTRTLTEAQVRAAASRWSDALALASQILDAIASNPRGAQFHRLEAVADEVAGTALLRTGQPSAALPYLQKNLALAQSMYDPVGSPRLAQALVAMGDCELTLGHKEAARALLEQAKAIHANHAELGPQYRLPLQALAVRLDT
jgi:serine/threonine protein kinase